MKFDLFDRVVLCDRGRLHDDALVSIGDEGIIISIANDGYICRFAKLSVFVDDNMVRHDCYGSGRK